MADPAAAAAIFQSPVLLTNTQTRRECSVTVVSGRWIHSLGVLAWCFLFQLRFEFRKLPGRCLIVLAAIVTPILRVPERMTEGSCVDTIYMPRSKTPL
ncbi:hypothetical protein HYQ44_000596 [Verticillium longisporum]|nr:hypothetical protein HYQ44_000596 [Verticillium longisporum]